MASSRLILPRFDSQGASDSGYGMPLRRVFVRQTQLYKHTVTRGFRLRSRLLYTASPKEALR